MKKLLLTAAAVFLLSVSAEAAPPEISAMHACLMEQKTGSIIYEYNGFEEYPMASTTKIMTAVVALENSKPDDEVTVSNLAVMQEGSSAYLRQGDKIPMGELLYGLMLNSGNDAAVAVAEHVSGNISCFAEKMNEKAAEIGAVNTSFKNPSGLDSEGHYTTAADLARISSYALNNEEFRKIVSTRIHKTDYSAGTLYFSNHNKLLNLYDGCIGVKTGYTKKVGRCLVSAAERDGVTLVCVTLGDPDDWRDHAALLDYGFENIRWKTVLETDKVLKELKSPDDIIIPVKSKEDFSLALCRGDESKLEVVLHTVPEVDADVEEGDKLGFCEVIFDGRVVAEHELVAGREYIKKKNFAEKFIGFFQKVFNFH
ncbi:MAG: D-alanyl-D-alanine carboxypeptidase [Clostridia bacterium]|nr:D-alanyl-D-alanine carboxypeptidase [Clostridia bacterium]